MCFHYPLILSQFSGSFISGFSSTVRRQTTFFENRKLKIGSLIMTSKIVPKQRSSYYPIGTVRIFGNPNTVPSEPEYSEFRVLGTPNIRIFY